MKQVPRLVARVRAGAHQKDVHALRVELRRVRSLALTIGGVDPHPGWHEVRRTSRRVFRALGELRDLQVARQHIEVLAPTDARVPALLRTISRRESTARRHVRRALDGFDAASWRHLAKQLEPRLLVVTPGSLAARSLLLIQVQEVRQRHAYAMRRPTSEGWHVLRKALKRLRDDVVYCAPALHVRWDPALRELQTLLGDVHDFDQLALLVSESSKRGDETRSGASLTRSIARARRQRVQAYRARTGGRSRPIERWMREVLPTRVSGTDAADAQLRAAAAAMHADEPLSDAVARMADRAFRKERSRFARREDEAHALLMASARLATARPDGKHHTARRLSRRIRALAPPPGWTPRQMTMVSDVVRQALRKNPAVTGPRLNALPPADRTMVLKLGAMLRASLALARPA